MVLWLIVGSVAITSLTHSWTRVAVYLLLGLQLVTFWGSHPHSIAWTAYPFRPAYRYVTDSNVDWGQDLYRLRAWSNDKEPFVAYFGWLGVPGSRPLSQTRPDEVEGWVAASGTYLTLRSELDWLRATARSTRSVGRSSSTTLRLRPALPRDRRCLPRLAREQRA